MVMGKQKKKEVERVWRQRKRQRLEYGWIVVEVNRDNETVIFESYNKQVADNYANRLNNGFSTPYIYFVRRFTNSW